MKCTYSLASPCQVTLADDRHIHIISGDGGCRQTFNVGELSFVSIVSHDLVSSSPGLELLVASRDGTVICVGQAPVEQVEPLSSLYSSPSEHLHNVATYYNGQVCGVLYCQVQSMSSICNFGDFFKQLFVYNCDASLLKCCSCADTHALTHSVTYSVTHTLTHPLNQSVDQSPTNMC